MVLLCRQEPGESHKCHIPFGMNISKSVLQWFAADGVGVDTFPPRLLCDTCVESWRAPVALSLSLNIRYPVDSHINNHLTIIAKEDIYAVTNALLSGQSSSLLHTLEDGWSFQKYLKTRFTPRLSFPRTRSWMHAPKNTSEVSGFAVLTLTE